VTRWVTEATPVSSVERKVIGLASAPWVEVGVVDSAEAVVDAAAVAGEDSVVSVTIAMSPGTSPESVLKAPAVVVPEADLEVAAVDAAAAEAFAITAKDLAIWLATARMSAWNAHHVAVVSAVDVVVGLVADAVVAVAVAAVTVSATNAKALVTSRGTASLANKLGSMNSRAINVWNKDSHAIKHPLHG